MYKTERWGETVISPPPAPPPTPSTPSGLSVPIQTGRHRDTVMPLSPPLRRSSYPPCCGFTGPLTPAAPLCSALAAACISPTAESAEPGMRLHTEQATYSLEELNTHRETHIHTDTEVLELLVKFARLYHTLKILSPCMIHIYHQGCWEIK